MVFNTIFRAYKHYQDGFLAEPGTVQDQPNVLMEAFDEIAAVKNYFDEADMNKDKQDTGDSGNFRSVLPK